MLIRLQLQIYQASQYRLNDTTQFSLNGIHVGFCVLYLELLKNLFIRRIILRRIHSIKHYNDVIMGAIAFQTTSLTIVYSAVYSGADQRKHESCALLAFVGGIYRGPVNSSHKWPVTQKMFPLDDVIMSFGLLFQCNFNDKHHTGNPISRQPSIVGYWYFAWNLANVPKKSLLSLISIRIFIASA